MNIIITGAFGFVGTNLSKSIKTAFNKHRLIAVDIHEPNKHDYDACFSWDELQKINAQDVDAVIHLAGKAHDTKNTTEEQSYFDINVSLTKKIFEFFLQSGAKKFIFFSSVKAVADTVPGKYLTEETTPLPATPYGRSKLAAEKYLLENNKQQTFTLWNHEVNIPSGTNNPGEISSRRRISRGKPGTLNFEPGTNDKRETTNNKRKTTNKSTYILRPCMIHGPGNKGNLNLLYKLVSKGIPWPLGAYENRRSFTSVGNLAYVINELLEKDIAPGTYNIADDEPLSTNRLIELIAASKAKKAKIWNINPRIISLTARAGDKMHLPLNSERLKKLTESYVVSNNKIKKALGIQMLPLTTEKGMKKTLESFR